MAEEVTLALLRAQFVRLDECFEALETQLAELRDDIERDLAGINGRLEKIEKRLARVERRA